MCFCQIPRLLTDIYPEGSRKNVSPYLKNGQADLGKHPFIKPVRGRTRPDAEDVHGCTEDSVSKDRASHRSLRP